MLLALRGGTWQRQWRGSGTDAAGATLSATVCAAALAGAMGGLAQLRVLRSEGSEQRARALARLSELDLSARLLPAVQREDGATDLESCIVHTVARWQSHENERSASSGSLWLLKHHPHNAAGAD